MSNFKNIESLIIPQDFDELATVTELQSIPLKKPGKQQFIRVKPDFCYRFGVIEVEGQTHRNVICSLSSRRLSRRSLNFLVSVSAYSGSMSRDRITVQVFGQ